MCPKCSAAIHWRHEALLTGNYKNGFEENKDAKDEYAEYVKHRIYYKTQQYMKMQICE